MDDDENPPLEELSLSVSGCSDKIPALDKHWVTREIFASYVSLMSPSGRVKVGSELEEWHYEADTFCDDFAYLLNCEHHVFWSYMVHDKAVLAALISFLQNATPFYIDLRAHAVDEATLEVYDELLRLVLRVIYRICTEKESPSAWTTTEHLRNLIYSNYLMSVPMLFDLLVVVGDADPLNVEVLRGIFDALLAIAPKYREDLFAALLHFQTVFRHIQTQTENEGFDGPEGGQIDESAETPYDDVALYTLDCAYSLTVLLEVCPPVRAHCGQLKLGQRIAHFYDSTIPLLYKNIFRVNESATSLSWLNQARLQFLRAFHYIAYSYVNKVLSSPENSLGPSEQYVALLTECLSEQMFVVDYQRAYPVEQDVDILKQACAALDNFKADFVVTGYQIEADTMAMGTVGNIAFTMEEAQLPASAATQPVATVDPAAEVSGISTGGGGHAAALEGRDIDLEVNAVLEMLPHLGTGFVRRLLARYEKSEDAIAAILEENLPPDLVDADQAEVHIPPDPQDKLFEQTGVQHYNVFDGDAYDVMTQDNPECIIKQGKGFPDAPQNAAQLLDDKRDLAKVRHRYQEYTLVEEGVADDVYEDEYDDSYEALLESETRVMRSKQLSAGLANVLDISEEESDEEDEAEEGTGDDNAGKDANWKGGKRTDFCENPEVVRQRYEAQRLAKYARKGFGGGGGGGSNGPTPAPVGAKSQDVVGAPKGQGQDKGTQRNRSQKGAHKSSRANHNRKSGAAFKRSKGMLP